MGVSHMVGLVLCASLVAACSDGSGSESTEVKTGSVEEFCETGGELGPIATEILESGDPDAFRDLRDLMADVVWPDSLASEAELTLDFYNRLIGVVEDLPDNPSDDELEDALQSELGGQYALDVLEAGEEIQAFREAEC